MTAVVEPEMPTVLAGKVEGAAWPVQLEASRTLVAVWQAERHRIAAHFEALARSGSG